MKWVVVCLGIFFALVGCKSGSTLARVDASMILPEGAARMKLEEKQVFLMPSEIESPAPAFPAGYSSKDMDVTVCAEFVVSAEGDVSSIRQLSEGEGCEPSNSMMGRAIFPEVQLALSRWSYFAGAICTFEVNKSECDGPDAKLMPTPVRLAYRFRFLISHGKKLVQASVSSGHR